MLGMRQMRGRLRVKPRNDDVTPEEQERKRDAWTDEPEPTLDSQDESPEPYLWSPTPLEPDDVRPQPNMEANGFP
jgi:hypothetical protein